MLWGGGFRNKQTSDNVVVFYSSTYFSFTEGVQWFILRKTNFFKVQGGSNIFQEVKMLISMETYRTFDFPGGPEPYPTPSGSAHDYFAFIIAENVQYMTPCRFHIIYISLDCSP